MESLVILYRTAGECSRRFSNKPRYSPEAFRHSRCRCLCFQISECTREEDGLSAPPIDTSHHLLDRGARAEASGKAENPRTFFACQSGFLPVCPKQTGAQSATAALGSFPLTPVLQHMLQQLLRRPARHQQTVLDLIFLDFFNSLRVELIVYWSGIVSHANQRLLRFEHNQRVGRRGGVCRCGSNRD